MDLEIVRLTVEQYDQIVALWQRSGLPYRPKGRDSRAGFELELSRPDNAAFGLVGQGRLLGVVMVSYDGRRGWINRLAIDPEVRGIGLASRLITAGELFLHERGARVIAALVNEENLPSISAFQKEGFGLIEPLRYMAKYDSPDS